MTRQSITEVERQVLATRERGVSVLPEAWFEPGCDERMAQWIERNVPSDQRLGFIYGYYTPPLAS